MKRIKLHFWAGIFLILFVGFVGVANAIPKLINLEGKLTNAEGIPLYGNFNMTFRIYNAASGGTLLWQERHEDIDNVTTSNIGIFSVLLGSMTTLDLNFTEDYWLEIQVNDEILTPRQKIASSPYTYITSMIECSTKFCIDYNTGKVGIGTTSPVHKLELADHTTAAGGIGFGTDVELYRSAANVLSLASGDSLNLFSGALQVGGVSAITSGRLFQAADGAVSGPGFAFSSETNTGMYRSSSGTLGFAGSGSSLATLSSSLLDITGDLEVSGNDIRDSTGTNRLTLGDPVVIGGTLRINDNDIQDSSGNVRIGIGSTNTISGNLNVDSGTFYVDASNDRVGIGTTNPTEKLVVYGNLSITDGGLKGATFYTSSDTQSSTTSTSYITKVSLTLPSGGTYIIIASCEVTGSSTSSSYFPYVRLQDQTGGVTIGGELRPSVHATATYANAQSWVVPYTISGPITIAIEYRAYSSYTAYIRNARIFALRVA